MQALDQRADLLLSSAEHNAALAHLAHGGLLPSALRMSGRLEYLPRLLKASVPTDVAQLPWEDVIAIRRDGYFEEWHALLSTALRRTPTDNRQSDAEYSHNLGDEVNAVTASLREKAAKSGLISRLKSTSTDIGVATVSGAGGLLITQGDPKGLAGAAVGITGKALFDWWRGRIRPGEQLILRHAFSLRQPR